MNNINSEEVRVNVQTNHNASVGNNAYEGGAVGNNAPDVDDNVLNSRPGRTVHPAVPHNHDVGNNVSTAKPRCSVRFATNNPQSIVNEGEVSA